MLQLERIEYCGSSMANGCHTLEALAFYFLENKRFMLEVNQDTDELIINDINSEYRWIDIANIYPVIAEAYGLMAMWSWKMENQKGYFDAIQLELNDSSLRKTKILQFKAAASGIIVCIVNEL